MQPQNLPISQNPIQDMQFKGLHWIEASAGSGKTYTLSSLVVRLLMDGYLPKQVVATTFTRAAAAELKTRIRLRLQQSYRFLNSKRELTEQENRQQASREGDLLFAKLQSDFANRMGYACERLKLVLQQLDELFVGTLDSFSQKLLREFAFESGRTESFAISEEPKQYSLELIHDALRQWIQQQPQNVIDWLNQAGQLHHPEHYLTMVEGALNFSAAKWPQHTAQPQDFSQQLVQMQQLNVDSMGNIDSRLQLSEHFFATANGNKFRNGSFAIVLQQRVPEWLSIFKQDDSMLKVWQFYQQHQKLLDTFFKHASAQDVFTKKLPEAEQNQFYQDPGVQALLRLIAHCQALAKVLQATASQLECHLCQVVQQRLPEALQKQRETTFAMQIQSLATALQGPQGRVFAKTVHTRYPLILVDEFQDTNHEQDLMLRSIWRQPADLQLGCMIMVGDRKQAIYGFRGGDMLTFIQAHAEVAQKAGHFYELAYNHRSVASLVQAVDALMQCNPDFGEQVIYRPIKAGSRPHPCLVDARGKNIDPLVWFLVNKAQEAEQVAWQILGLFEQSARGELFFDDGMTQRPLQQDDIAVLATSHRQLDAVQNVLERYRLAVHRPSKRSVFDSSSALDVAAILLALQHPYHEARLKRALLTRMMGFNVERLAQLSATSEGLSTYMAQFDGLQKLWREQGFMRAWQKLLSQFAVWENMVATQADDNERSVVNLRHLSEILHQHSQHYTGMHRLITWYLKQIQKPSQRDWELERKLSKTVGIQLLSIHQSKGLEFKIVFLLGANKKPSTKTEPLNFSTQPVTDATEPNPPLQRVIQLTSDPNLSTTAKNAHIERQHAEQHRLWYVAITRASHRVYALWHTDDAKDSHALAFWRNASAAVTLPYSREQTELASCPEWRAIAITQNASVAELQVQAWPSQGFFPRTKTSFTALAPQHQHTGFSTQDALAILPETQQPSADETITANDLLLTVAVQKSECSSPNTLLPWLCRAFPKGAQAGNFLHELFEAIDFHNSSDWPDQLRRRFDNQYPLIKAQLWQRYRDDFADQLHSLSQDEQQAAVQQAIYTHMQAWMQQILSTPLHDDFQLSQLLQNTRVAEFDFDLALKDQIFRSQHIQHILAQHLQAQFNIDLPDLMEAHTARYLTGSIDLLYWHNEKFYIADYKSNFLGSYEADYAPLSIQHSMTAACYWLQAALYLVAVHRYLTVHWPDYNIHQHLGGASYLYLRGMQGVPQQGVMFWPANVALILALDAALGYANTFGNSSENSEVDCG